MYFFLISRPSRVLIIKNVLTNRWLDWVCQHFASGRKMKYSKLSFLIPKFFLITIALLYFSALQASTVFEVKVDDYPPYVILDTLSENGDHIEGIVPEFLHHFAKEYPEYKFHFVYFPRARADSMMAYNSSEIDLTMMSPAFAKKDVMVYYRFTDPIFPAGDSIFSLKEKPLQFEKVSDLYGKRIGTIRGYGYAGLDADLASGKIIDQRVNSIQQNINKLLLKRLDGFIASEYPAKFHLKGMGVPIEQFHVSEKKLYSFDLMYLVKKTHKSLIKDMNTYIKKVKKEGLVQEWVDKYTK
jgi:hypothetical protein